MSKASSQVDGFIRKNKKWQDALSELRAIILETELVEEVKWRVPCYTIGGKNVLFIGPMKDWCAISFIKGALMKDAKKILIQQTEQSQSVRIIRFASADEIKKLRPVLKAYVEEAIAIEKSGAKVKLKKITEFKVPDELQAKLDEMPSLKKAFTALTPGRQRGYMIYVAGAKQSETRKSRVEKHVKRILSGKGIDDE